MLKLENVSKYYDDFLAVDNLSFEVKPGEIFGLLGVNGAGKTLSLYRPSHRQPFGENDRPMAAGAWSVP